MEEKTEHLENEKKMLQDSESIYFNSYQPAPYIAAECY